MESRPPFDKDLFPSFQVPGHAWRLQAANPMLRAVSDRTSASAYAVSGATPGRSSGALSAAGKTAQVAWCVASSGQFT